MGTGIPEDARAEIGAGLSRLMADTYTLYLATHGYHWNVTGPLFHSLHQMFEAQYLELWAAVDVIAERIRALGLAAPGSSSEIAALASVEEGGGAPQALEMVKRLIEGHETVIDTAREVVELAEAGGDVASADLATQRIEAHEKTAWMLRSMAA